MKSVLIMISLMIVMTFTSCDDDSTSPTETRYLVPLKTGNSWEFQLNQYDEEGNITESKTETMRVVGSEEYGDETYYKISFIGNEDVYFLNRGNGLYSYEAPGDEEKSYFKYPGKAGDKYTTSYGNFEIVSVNESITVGAGTFSCYKFYITDNDTSEEFSRSEIVYFCPGIGIIKDDITIISEDTQYKNGFELLSYSLK